MAKKNKKSNGEGLMGGLSTSSAYPPQVKLPAGVSAGVPTAMGSVKVPRQQKSPDEIMKELEDKKKKFEGLKKKILKKYKFTRFLSILPEQALGFFAEDENMPRETEHTKPTLLIMCIPEDNFKEMEKIRNEVIKMIKETKENAWLIIKTEVDLWNYGLDSKFEFLDAVAMSFPLYDSGFLGSLRVANIHKALVMMKFEKYVASYIVGGSLVRGTTGPDSDVDTFVIIDDTDVKRMNRIELLERLRGFINEFIREASIRAGVKNVLHVQVYLLTDFWQSVKDANPVMYTFIRDGIPFYDRGTFIPWKLLLKMGKIKPSPEAVDMFMKSGEQTDGLLKRRMLDGLVDIYWGITTPTQALMMLAGQAPPAPKTIVQEVKEVLVKKEKVMSMKELKTLEKIVGLYKTYEHGKLKEISGKEIDELKKEHDDYIKKMKQIRGKLEARMQEHSVVKIHDEIFDLLKKVFGNKSQDALIKEVEKLISEGKIAKRMGGVVKEITNVKRKMKSKRLNQTQMQKLLGDSTEFAGALTEYAQRKELVVAQKGILQIRYGGKKAQVILTDNGVFVVESSVVRKISGKKLVDSTKTELENAIKNTKEKLSVPVASNVFDILKKEIGAFELVL